MTGCSAVGYFFASLLQRVLDVPVGLLDVSCGGTRVESWLDRENLSLYTDEPTDTAGIVAREPVPARRAMVWHNGMFAPILNYTVRGIMFYQGCSNVGDPGNQYSQRLELIVRQWRRQFALGDIPFYNVQLAPYWAGNDMGTNFMLLREQQRIASERIPNVRSSVWTIWSILMSADSFIPVRNGRSESALPFTPCTSCTAWRTCSGTVRRSRRCASAVTPATCS